MFHVKHNMNYFLFIDYVLYILSSLKLQYEIEHSVNP